MFANQSSEQQRVTALMYQMAQSLIAHDDFTILPQDPRAGQDEGEDGVSQAVLYRRQFNTMQVVRLIRADRHDLGYIERLMQEEVRRLDAARRENAVGRMYVLTFFIFPHWRSDENIRAVSQAGVYAGLTRNRGALAVAVDAARGVLGPVPGEDAGKEISFDRLAEIVARFPNEEFPAEVLERTPQQWEAQLGELSHRRQERVEQVMRPEGKTRIVTAVLALTVMIWLLATAYPNLVLGYGLMIPGRIQMGEFWRLITPMFLHYEFAHLAFNMLSLYVFGRFVERIYGSGRFAVIYLLAGIAGCLLSFALNDQPSLGASGAVFGLFGALLAFGQYDRRAFAMTIGASVYGLLIMNLIFGFLMPNVDNWGHIGGLIGGYLTAMMLGLQGRAAKRRAMYALGYAAFAVLTFGVGMR
ncbi:rhomboid family intramembrane serine protease [Tumebacillus sp. DT12]|uniref:Rhomboid family intramembrane serine protease n=1 Tax=Tumebacillus lacus TaxID=2995335 RepID=A0ABT3WWE6_9BACL|nr:rhomboid family intramembrane serine protease [Tumebacillus lacus]MCX7568995.1 rhomboid family intramembrane serine protease [Tumebacillus lacus]